MNVHVIVALVSGAFTFAGVVMTVWAGNNKTNAKIKEQTDLTIYRIEQLEKKQDMHNTLIERMYKAEEKIDLISLRVDDLDHKGV